ncbi:MAG: sulfatase [bacterium]
MRSLWIAACAAVALAGCAKEAPSGRGIAEGPNLLLVSLDTVRADALGAFGNPRALTPHLDRLARSGVTFSNAIAQASSTLPSHRSMFRSRVASRSTGDEPMLAEILQGAGWHTVAFTGGGNLSRELGFAVGFDQWEEADGGFGWALPRFAAWLDAREPGPFFAFLHTYDAHLPYDPPPPWAQRLDPDYQGWVTGAETRPLCRTLRELPVEEDWSGRTDLSARDREHVRALYDAGVAALDSNVGRLVRDLEARGLSDDLVIAVMSDHGEEFWDHGSVIHSHTVYQELVHVPLIVVSPEDRGHGVRGGVVRNLDIAPTLLDAAGLDAVPSHEGTSLRGVLRGAADRNRPAVSEMRQAKSLIDWPWKLIARREGGELYHLADDPGERRNLARELEPLAVRLGVALGDAVASGEVRELSGEDMSPELVERLKALGYLE